MAVVVTGVCFDGFAPSFVVTLDSHSQSEAGAAGGAAFAPLLRPKW